VTTVSSGPRPERRSAERRQLADLAPLLRRVQALQATAVTRLRHQNGKVTALIQLPFAVLVGRTISVDPALLAPELDHEPTVGVAALLAWLDGHTADPPPRQDQAWRGAVPPASGWRSIDVVPATVVRDLVAAGTRTLREAAQREGLGDSATPRTAVVEALLDSVVVTASADAGTTTAGAVPVRAAPSDTVEITLRPLSALTRMGFLFGAEQVKIDVNARWIRVATQSGSAYLERPGLGLTLLR
jgi:hypothetical protein